MMKKFKNTKFAHIGASYTPSLDAKFDKVESDLAAQRARFDEIERRIKALMSKNGDYIK